MKSFLLTIAFLFGGLSITQAQLSSTPISIPMRDGQSLAADLYLPDPNGSFPVILIQTPYNKNTFQFSLPLGIGMDLEDSPYAFVVVDWRCFYGSIGACTADVNRGEDGYDAVEWIAEQDWSDGKIGTWGPSALGQVQFETAREQPPHLVCAMPSVASPQTTYKSYYPGGSIRVEFVETFGILFGGGGNDIVVANPNYNALWQFVESNSLYPGEITVPMFLVAGWYDHNTEDCFFMFDQLRSNSDPTVRNQHKMIIGPWVHGGTGFASVGSDLQGELSYPDAQGFNALFGRQFFDYYLRGITSNNWESYAPYYYFQMGTDEWQELDVWPPVEAEEIDWYAHADGQLLPQLPSASEGQLNFSYDPEDPSPTIGGKTLNIALEQGPFNQVELVEDRSDVAIFSSPILEEDITLQGRVKVQLSVSTDRLDTDFTIRLTDVYPDGRSMLLGEGIQRLRYRDGNTEADITLAQPGEVYTIEIELEELAITFLAGHQIRLVVSSSNYPRYNRNMNTGGEMYPNGEIDVLIDPLVAENVVYANANQVSKVILPLVDYESPLSTAKTLSANWRIYPNPVEDWLILEGLQERAQYELLDTSGTIWKQGSVDPDRAIYLVSLPAGTYLLRAWDSKGFTLVEKIVRMGR